MSDNKVKITLDSIESGATVRVSRVNGEGAFRQRLLEMGFIGGTEVSVVKNAPLQDPVEYLVMGTHISLRRSEARQIEVLPLDATSDERTDFNGTLESAENTNTVDGNVIHVALVGNPNCGKTSLFNYATGAHEKVGNYGGVTVDSKVAIFKHNGYTIQLADLPGTYSLTEYSPEEMYVRTYLRDNNPDVIVNIVDSNNMERNMFLTTQIMDMDHPMVLALNMWDELEKSGDKIDTDALADMLGAAVVPLVAREGKGLDKLLDAVVDTAVNHKASHKTVNYGAVVEESLQKISKLAPQADRYTCLKLIENDKHALEFVAKASNADEVMSAAKTERERIEKDFNNDITTVFSDLKYGFVRGALAQVLTRGTDEQKRLGYALDVVLTNRWLGIPLLILMMWIVFEATFIIGAYPQDWIETGMGMLGDWVGNMMPDGALKDLVVDGVIGGVGGVLVFLPNIIILFFFISILEDSGYLARAAFIVDRLMHKVGLHGRSFIPYIIGFGCGVPAIMATRTLENRRDRIITILTIPFMSCTARLPLYLLIVSAFFSENQGLILMSIYLVGIVVAALTSILLHKTILKHESSEFVMELPPYRVPTARNATIHMWNKTSQYLKKMGTVILFASIVVWALGYFPHNDELSPREQVESSYIGRMGKAIEPVFEPLGFNWQMDVSLITGAAAKEIVVSSMGVLYTGEEDLDEESESLREKLQTEIRPDGTPLFTPIIAYAFMLFVLLYFPCIAALAAVRREAGTKWMVFTIFYTTGVAWLVSFLFYQIANLIV